MKSGLKISDHSLRYNFYKNLVLYRIVTFSIIYSADSCRVMCVKTISEVKLTQEGNYCIIILYPLVVTLSRCSDQSMGCHG